MLGLFRTAEVGRHDVRIVSHHVSKLHDDGDSRACLENKHERTESSMPSLSPSLGLTITNPLVLYRTLLATQKIDPDPAQHRLALHLQKVYNRLNSYNPEVDYNHRLDQITQAVGKPLSSSTEINSSINSRAHGKFNGIFSSLRANTSGGDTLAITKRLTSYESAVNIQSPQGLLLYGDVGTGKSMLIDLLADCLPAQKRRRCHFNNFMLEIFSRLELLRKKRYNNVHSMNPERSNIEEHSLLCIARDLISTSPILFLDEFQLPDRAASKILTNLLTPFFHLGGVLIATSNRMPEELAKASGIDFAAPPSSRLKLLRSRWGSIGGSEHYSSGKGDFALFLDILRARCEIWDMEGGKDWRRRKRADDISSAQFKEKESSSIPGHRVSNSPESLPLRSGEGSSDHSEYMNESEIKEMTALQDHDALPDYYFVRESLQDLEAAAAISEPTWMSALHAAVPTISPSLPPSAAGIPWTSSSLRVYGRIVLIPRHQDGVAYWTFTELCCANLGPADYISIASNFHTVILTEVPILTLLHKNEARRFITLLDALYEARCKLLIHATAGPDAIFFPEAKQQNISSNRLNSGPESDHTTEAIYSETLAEIYQDQTSPFRPNTASTYSPSASPPSYSQFPTQRSMLADEDSDFGPYPHNRFARPHGQQTPRGSSDGPPGAGNEIGRTTPDFSHAGAFTGEDERFAYKRAQSRLWEMCSARWWASREAKSAEKWWRPVLKEARPWEGQSTNEIEIEKSGISTTTAPLHAPDSATQMQREGMRASIDEELFRHGASPFRVHAEPPPKFGWMHVWGMMRWGRKAGAWGKGVDGLRERRGVVVDGLGERREKGVDGLGERGRVDGLGERRGVVGGGGMEKEKEMEMREEVEEEKLARLDRSGGGIIMDKSKKRQVEEGEKKVVDELNERPKGE